ncbi:Rid family hydrolase [Streptomyces sp. DSM 44917]|uniref:Rid family hydrolase n=1 Tax=Streptomyces boetiae TaxID=3075541 RepID=A0ABU2LD14_9ACTN|nr:Rid family hydrolase [Streptomyces sp. DSM 44917]MDT0309466.1 Rid family hydrolase [Streptomyces sp. DSM 44917]
MSRLSRPSRPIGKNGATRAFRTTRRARLGAAAGAVCLLLAGASVADARGWWSPRGNEVRVMLPEGQNNPAIANGVAIGRDVALYESSGLGPAGLNPAAPAGTPERYTDPALTAGKQGVTITEAQALLVLRAIVDNLQAAGLRPRDVITMTCYLTAPPGQETADYAGWNRAYRQYFANVDLATREVIEVPMGTSPPEEPLVPNAARPARATMEVASLAVPGWLVEVEVTAAYPARR